MKIKLLGCKLHKKFFSALRELREVHKKILFRTLRTSRSSQEIFALAMQSSHCALRKKKFDAKYVETLSDTLKREHIVGYQRNIGYPEAGERNVEH